MTIFTIPVGALETNCYLLADEQGQALLLDPGDEAERIEDAIRKHGLTVNAILLTHAHFDHFLAAETLRTATGAPLWVPAADAARLTDPAGSLLEIFAAGSICPRPADRLLSDGDRLRVGGIRLTVRHTPGHTPGSSCFETDGGRVLFSGDTLFANGCGRTDFPGGSDRDMRRSLETLRERFAGFRAYPGHGPAFTI